MQAALLDGEDSDSPAVTPPSTSTSGATHSGRSSTAACHLWELASRLLCVLPLWQPLAPLKKTHFSFGTVEDFQPEICWWLRFYWEIATAARRRCRLHAQPADRDCIG